MDPMTPFFWAAPGSKLPKFKPMGHYGIQKGQIKINRLGFTPQESDRTQPAAEYGRR